MSGALNLSQAPHIWKLKSQCRTHRLTSHCPHGVPDPNLRFSMSIEIHIRFLEWQLVHVCQLHTYLIFTIKFTVSLICERINIDPIIFFLQAGIISKVITTSSEKWLSMIFPSWWGGGMQKSIKNLITLIPPVPKLCWWYWIFKNLDLLKIHCESLDIDAWCTQRPSYQISYPAKAIYPREQHKFLFSVDVTIVVVFFKKIGWFMDVLDPWISPLRSLKT